MKTNFNQQKEREKDLIRDRQIYNKTEPTPVSGEKHRQQGYPCPFLCRYVVLQPQSPAWLYEAYKITKVYTQAQPPVRHTCTTQQRNQELMMDSEDLGTKDAS